MVVGALVTVAGTPAAVAAGQNPGSAGPAAGMIAGGLLGVVAVGIPLVIVGSIWRPVLGKQTANGGTTTALRSFALAPYAGPTGGGVRGTF
jgi:hypothetical protein